jgi:restriction system protein
MAKKYTSFFDLLIQAPWWVPVAVAAITYVFLVLIFPNIQTANPMITAIFIALSQAAPFFTGVFLLATPFAYFNSRRKQELLDRQQDIDSIKALSWKEFEELVAEAYRRQGFRVIENGFGPDGGVDVKLSKNKQTILVQCKQWKSKNVGVAVIREMFGILTSENATKVVIICCGGFTREASNFAENKPIELIDGTELLSIVKDIQCNSSSNVENSTNPMPLESSQQLEPSPNVNQAPCPKCGNQLVQRQAKRGANLGHAFLGCSSFPKCRYTKDMHVNCS